MLTAGPRGRDLSAQAGRWAVAHTVGDDGTGGRRARARSGPTKAEHLRRTALEALAHQPDHLVIDLRDVEDSAQALHQLHEVQDAARDSHCRVTFELPRLTVLID